MVDLPGAQVMFHWFHCTDPSFGAMSVRTASPFLSPVIFPSVLSVRLDSISCQLAKVANSIPNSPADFGKGKDGTFLPPPSGKGAW